IVTSILVQNPARCSSIELSRTSKTMWCNPRSSGSPIYMPGRFRTASSPSNLSIWAASYFCVWLMPVASVWRFRLSEFSSSITRKAEAGIYDEKDRRKTVFQQPICCRFQGLFCATNGGEGRSGPHYLVEGRGRRQGLFLAR